MREMPAISEMQMKWKSWHDGERKKMCCVYGYLQSEHISGN